MKRQKVFSGSKNDFNERYQKSIDTLLLESERGVVLAAAAIIEEDLEILLRGNFINGKAIVKNIIDPLFSGVGPLSTFSAKIKMAYVLNLIDATLYKDIDAIRSIRNYFAHTYNQVTFQNQRVKNILNNIVTNPIPTRKYNFLFWEFKCPETKRKKKIPVDQYKFIMCASCIDLEIQNLFGRENICTAP